MCFNTQDTEIDEPAVQKTKLKPAEPIWIESNRIESNETKTKRNESSFTISN